PIVATGGFTFMGPLIINGTVAKFTDTGGPELPFDYTATIDWGDGSTDTGIVTLPDASGVFSVLGNHAYSSMNPFVITVTITHETAPPVVVRDFVNAGPVNATGGFTINGLEGQLLSNVTVATFTDPFGPQQANAYSATINWGDGTTSLGTVTGPDQ